MFSGNRLLMSRWKDMRFQETLLSGSSLEKTYHDSQPRARALFPGAREREGSHQSSLQLTIALRAPETATKITDEPTGRCRQNPFIRALRIHQSVIPREPQMKGKSVSSRVPWKLSPVTTNCCITVNRLEAVIQTILQRRFQANREQGLSLPVPWIGPGIGQQKSIDS